MPIDPVMAAFERAESPTRAWLAACTSFADTGKPSLAEVARLAALVEVAQADIWQVALEQPDWGSGERYRL